MSRTRQPTGNLNALTLLGSINLRHWSWLSAIGIILLIVLQIVMSETLPGSALEWYLVPIVYVPLALMTLSVAYFQESILKWLQPISMLYVIFAGPVFIISRAWLLNNQFEPFTLSPLYITIIFCSCYYLGLRFVYSAGVALIAIAAWFAWATPSWRWQLENQTGELV